MTGLAVQQPGMLGKGHPKRWLTSGLTLVVLASNCTATMPPGVELTQPLSINGKTYQTVKGLLPGRYSAQEEALRAACDKYLNLPGAFNPFDRNLDPQNWRDYWARASVEYCGIVFRTGANEFGNSTITMEEIQRRDDSKTCIYPDFVLLEDGPGHFYSDKKALAHNHGGSTGLTAHDCEALEKVLAFEARLLSPLPENFSMTMAAFIGRQGQSQVVCAGWYELTIQYSKSGYEGQRATATYYDASSGRYDDAKSAVFDLNSCEVKQ